MATQDSGSDGEGLQGPSSSSRGGGRQSRHSGPEVKKRKMTHESSEISANCCLAGPEFMQKILNCSANGNDGIVFGFAADMEGVGNIPRKTYLQMLGLLLVLNLEDDEADILADLTVVCTPVSRKGTKLKSVTVRNPRRKGGGSISRLLKMDPDEFRLALLGMEDSVGGEQVAEPFFGNEGGGTKEPLTNGKLFMTTHVVTYQMPDGEENKKHALVLWMVTHKNFDFVGKLNRLFGNPETWRKHLAGKNEKDDIADKERQYGYWQEILHGLVEAVRLPKIWRAMEYRWGMSPMHNALNGLHPEAFYNLSNPMAVYYSITFMCPDEATNVVIEGMDYGDLQTNGIDMLQYTLRYVAWRRQFASIKQEQQRRKEELVRAAKAKVGKGKKAADAAEDEDCGMQEIDPGMGIEQENMMEGIEEDDGDPFVFSGVDGDMVKTVLYGQPIDFFDEYERAINVCVPGWPLPNSTFDELCTGIPVSSVVLYVDFSGLSKHMAMLPHITPDWLQGHFGEMPSKARCRVQNSMMGPDGQLPEESFLCGKAHVTEAERQAMYVLAQRPLQSFLFDRVYAPQFDAQIRIILERSSSVDRLLSLAGFYKSMRNLLRSDLLAGKSRSMVLQSTQVYVDSMEYSIGPQVYGVMKEYQNLFSKECSSDVETSAQAFHKIAWEFNTSYWGLTGRNFLILMNFLTSEMAWRMGTSGGWKWIGMAICVLDGAGTLETKGGMNMKKTGTCGFDYTRSVYRNVRSMYLYVVDQAVLEQFGNGKADGHLCSSTMRMTPGSVGDGVIQVLDDTVVDEPTKTLGTMLFFPEGLGDNKETVDLVVKLVPRDDNLEFKLETTVDMGRTGMRKKLTKEAVPGMTMCICAFARNQQPKDLETQQRMDDFLRVTTQLPSSGLEDTDERGFAIEKKYDRNLPWNAGKRKGRGATGNVLAGNTGTMTKAECIKYGSFFSMVHMVGTLACLQQKCGSMMWNISPDLNFVLRQLYTMIMGNAVVMLSKNKLHHGSRYFDSAICQAGISTTVLYRSYAVVSECGKKAKSMNDAIDTIAQLQCEDALHFSQVPAVMMRFVSGMLDYQTLVVMSALFRAVALPVIDVMSALELLSGVPVTNIADRSKVQKYLNRCLNTGSICPTSEFDMDVRQQSNASGYVTSPGRAKSASPVRTKCNVAHAQNKDPLKFQQETLQRHAISVLEWDVRQYGQFCGDHFDLSIASALTKMQQNDFNLHALLGGGAMFYDHKKIIAVLQDGTTGPLFKGIPDMNPSDQTLLRVMSIGNGEICYGVNIFSGLMLSALMQRHAKDWGLQTNVAESLVSFMIEKSVPYSLLPVKKTMMDTYKTHVGVVYKAFEPAFRPLQMPRMSCNSRIFDPKAPGASDNKEGVSGYGVFEDTAHMQPILSMATQLSITPYNHANLCAWEFEVRWGGVGDITPLRVYPNNTLGVGPMYKEEFAASPQHVGFVAVGENNILQLVVLDASVEGSGASTPCGLKNSTRSEQQAFIFRLGWGPALNVRRNGVALKAACPGGGLRTLVPYARPPPEEMMRDGISGIRFYQDGYYLVSGGADEDPVRTRVEDVESIILPYGTTVAVGHEAPEIAEYVPHAAAPRSGREFPMRHRFQLAKVVLDDAVVPTFGVLALVLKVCDGRSMVQTLRVNVDPKHVRQFEDVHGYQGCHQHIIYKRWLQAQRVVADGSAETDAV